MGEDRSTCTEKKANDVIAPPCRHRHSSVISSCSEDAESESTSAGYPQTPDEERDEELEYGPGIVNKLRTRFLSISLKQNRGTNMRRSCSMENLLDQDRPCNPMEKTLGMVNGSGLQNNPLWGNLKRAKSMDTLLMELQPESNPVKDLHLETGGEDKRVPKIVKRREGGGLSRLCDEELPKPDTVKTYKRMFEPAESRRGSHGRRPPVLRASARSCAASRINGIGTNTSAKVNGMTTRSKYSAKQSPPMKGHQESPVVNGNAKKPVLNGEPSRPLYNGCHVVKANPVKISSSTLRNGRDMEKNLNSINRLLNKKEVHFAPKTDIITNGNGCHEEILKIKTNDDVVKQFSKPTSPNHHVIMNGNAKPKVPPNRPSLKPPKTLLKPEDQKSNEKCAPKLKPRLVNGLKKPFEVDHKKSALITPSKDSLKVVHGTKPKVETNSPEIKPAEIKLQSEDKTKLPLENEVNGSVKPEIEHCAPSELKKPAEDPSPNPAHTEFTEKEDPKPQAKDSNLKVSERTAEPDLKHFIGKPPKAPAPVPPARKLENGHLPNLDTDKSKISKQEIVQDVEVKRETKPVKKQQPAQTTSMVFDFRGKDVVPHVAVLPVPFGCKALHPKKRPVVDGKEVPNSNGIVTDEEDEDYVDYSVPPPSGVVFEGENVKIGRGSILATRNKDLKITFDDDVDNNTFVYPSETSLLEDPERSLSPTTSGNEIIPNGLPPPKLKTNTSIGSSSAGGLSTYTPSVLRTVDNFEPGMFRPSSVQPEKDDDKHRNPEEEENTEVREEHAEDASSEMLKPADPDLISSWSLSAGTSDLLF